MGFGYVLKIQDGPAAYIVAGLKLQCAVGRDTHIGRRSALRVRAKRAETYCNDIADVYDV